ncbi:MAG: hypothetical protein A3D87_03480 [Omnitrophica WOR_2 bacterium RIFCSPHIGHO2_02_FULL_50_17]|nr:MAG: hypothetical protein A3D87_03480 [Omnitrophica WOR_2 bacterium RIFCSPHIGHO2_02_FULL_50_17]
MSKKFIIYLTTSGAGSHIIRSIMMDLHNKGTIEPINHDQFWAKAAAAMIAPDTNAFEEFAGESVTHWDILAQLCSAHGITLEKEELTKERIFRIFEEIYFDNVDKPIFDFSRKYTTQEGPWKQKYVDVLHDLILDYYRYEGKKISLKFICQVRDPLDNIASLHERFNKQIALNESRGTVLSNLLNLQRLLPELSENDYVFLRFEEIIASFEALRDGFKKKLGLEVQKNFYLSDISIKKWPSCPPIYDLLDDKALMENARRFSYSYKRIGGLQRSFYLIKNSFQREIKELRLVRDAANGRLNQYNSILNKHARRGKLAGLYLSLLFFIQRQKFKNYMDHVENFNRLLVSHNKKTMPLEGVVQ